VSSCRGMSATGRAYCNDLTGQQAHRNGGVTLLAVAEAGNKAGGQRSVLFEQQNHVAMGVNFIAVAEVGAGPSSLDSGDPQVWSPG
jgi:hypothetical protein